MKKSKLINIPIRKRETPDNDCKWTLEANIYSVSGEDILLVDAYYKRNIEPGFRVYLSKSAYITLDLQGKLPEWKTGRICHYIYINYWNRNEDEIYISDLYEDIICDFIGVHGQYAYDAIIKFQDSILSAEILRKEKKLTDPIDKKMEDIKELPDDFEDWLRDDVFLSSRYIYYRYQSKVHLPGYCTHCGNDVTVYKPKHNEKGICPSCGSSIIYKSIGKSTNIIDKRNVAVFQKTDNGFAIRYFAISKHYGRNYKCPTIYSNEFKRDFYNELLELDSYVYEMFKNKYCRWLHRSDSGIRWRNDHVYPYNIKQIVENTSLKYAALDVLAGNRNEFSFNIEKYINDYSEGCTFLEHFVKVGLYNLVKDVVSSWSCNEINIHGKTLNSVLGIQNDDIKILIEADTSIEGLELFKIARKQGKRLTSDQLKEVQMEYDPNRFKVIFTYVPVYRALKYLRSLPAYVSEKDLLYRDYLESCVKLKQDMKNSFVLYPKDIRMAHDINVELINEKANQKMYKQHNSKYAEVRKISKKINELYYFEDENFIIRAPKDAAEIVKEGQSLHHCVGGGGYSASMAKGEIAILFLRDVQSPDTPYYTIEINRHTNKIVQCHGYRNKDTDKTRIDRFLKKFKKAKLENHESIKKVG